MKINKSNRWGEAGNLILVALMISGIAGLTLGSYLLMTQQQSVSIFRSQTWNTTMPVTEAGIEDGLQLINLYAGSFDDRDLFKWTNNAAGAGWDNPSANIYHVKRYIADATTSGTTTNSYEVWISNTNNAPSVIASGTVPWTYLYAANSAAQPLFATVGTAPNQTAPPPSINRRVFVQTHFDPLFVVAMAAIGTIDLRGNNIATDSFDSSSSLFSNNGQYPSGMVGRTRANGDVCTDGSLVNSLNVGNADIKGTIRTGPGTNTIYIGPNGAVGDSAWVQGGNTGIETGHSTTDFNVLFPPVVAPSALWLPPLPGIVINNGITYTTVITSGGYYTLPGLTQSMLINAPSNDVVDIRIMGNVSLGGNDLITIAPTGARVRIFMYGNSFSLTGNATINNDSGFASNFYLYGMQSCNTINLGGNGGFCGGVYAPNADFTLGGGGGNTWDFIGSSVTRTVSMNGHFNFHYDENLAKVGPGRGYIPVAWREQ